MRRSRGGNDKLKIITTELQNGVTADSEDSEYPDDNLLDNYLGKPWKATSGDNTAQVTVTFASGGCNAFALFKTNATSCNWTLKNNLGSTVDSGSVNLASPVKAENIWIEFSAQTNNGSMVLDLTGPSGTAVYAGVVKAGVYESFDNPVYGLRDTVEDLSLVRETSNKSLFIVDRGRILSHALVFDLARDYSYFDLRQIYIDNGAAPLAWLLADDLYNHVWCGLYHMISFEGDHSDYDNAIATVTIRSAV